MSPGAGIDRESRQHDAPHPPREGSTPEVMVDLKDILLAHPSKHSHAYEVAVALQERGRLVRFITGIYDRPDSWFSTAARLASRITRRDHIERLLSRRRHPGIDAKIGRAHV